jgi:phage-related protein
MIRIPRANHRDSGLHFRSTVWCAVYYKGSRTYLRSLGTADIEKARIARDEFYAKLVSEGAQQREKKGRPKSEQPYIYLVVKVPGRKAMSAKTMDEAIALRDSLLAEKAAKP